MRNRRSIVSLSILVALLAVPALAQYDPPFPPEEFAARRAAFYDKLGDGLAIVLGALEPADYSGFRQDNDMEYFTGVETQDAVLLLDGQAKKATLFLPTLSARELVKTGPHLQPGEEAAKLTGLDGVEDLGEFAPTILRTLLWRSFTGSEKVYVSALPVEIPAFDSAFDNFVHAQQPWDGRLTRYQTLVKWLRERAPTVEIASYTRMIAELRQIKSPREIEMMRKAAHLTALAENEAIRATRPGRYEYQVSAVAEFVMKAGGAQRLAWRNIVASGPNTLNWHYDANSRQMQAGDVVLADIGAEYNYYNADLTRTWPVSGRFTPEQRKMYDCLLETQKKAIAAVKPGATIKDLVKIMKEVFEQHGYGEYAGHGIGHFVGMATHDLGNYFEPFQPGQVFNVEPILEIPEKGIHMRLEDTVLITKDGHEVLTKEAPMEVEEIYKLYDEGSKLLDR